MSSGRTCRKLHLLGYFGGERAITARLPVLPLSLILATVLGVLLLPDLSVAVVLIVACVVVPTDFSPVSSMLRDKSFQCAFAT